MIAYQMVGVRDLDVARAFYDTVLGALGAGRAFDSDRMQAWASPNGGPMIVACTPYDGKPSSTGNGAMTALAASSTEQVDSVYRAALKAGGTDEGAPGDRANGAGYFAYFRDPDGNKFSLAHFYGRG